MGVKIVVDKVLPKMYSAFAMANKKKVTLHAFKPTEDDREIIAKIKHKLGTQNISDIIRMGLRALAEKQGVAA